MSDLRREIEKIITAYCSFCATGQCFGHEKVADVRAVLFEKRRKYDESITGGD